MKNKCILGTKIGMTQLIQEDGTVEPVTIVKSTGCVVVDVYHQDSHGYDGLLLGYGDVKEKHLNKPQTGFFKSKKVDARRSLQGVKVADVSKYEQNQALEVDLFDKDEKVHVRSKSIGRGFTGTIKRHGFARGPMSHGSKNHRLPGSIGGGTYPGHVIKGKRMSGHYGNTNVTIKNLVVLDVDKDKGLLFIKGSVPGKKNNTVFIYN